MNLLMWMHDFDNILLTVFILKEKGRVIIYKILATVFILFETKWWSNYFIWNKKVE